MALAHAIGNKTGAAYRRGELFETRRALLLVKAAWREPKFENEVQIKRPKHA